MMEGQKEGIPTPQAESNYKKQMATHQANRDDVLRLRAEGKTLNEIIEVTDLSRASVSGFLSASRIKTRAKEEMVKRWRSSFGMSRAMAIKQIEATQVAAQVKTRRPSLAQDKSDDVLRLKAEGKTVREIAAEAGISQSSTFRILKAFKVKRGDVLRLAGDGMTRTKIVAKTGLSYPIVSGILRASNPKPPIKPIKKHTETTLTPDAGQLFKVSYLQGLKKSQPPKKLADSEQLRQKMAAFFEAYIMPDKQGVFADGIKRELGIDYPWTTYGLSHHGFWLKADLVDFLSAITIFLKVVGCKPNAIAKVRQIFNEENTHYRVDDKGGVHYPWRL